MTVYNTTNKFLYVPGNNDEINRWDIPLNTNWTGLDYALGGATYISVTGQSGTKTMIKSYSTTAVNNQYKPNGVGSIGSPVTSDPSCIPPNIIITGNLSENINYQLPAGVGGQWSIYNNTTILVSGKTITFSISGGNSITLENAKRRLIISDGTAVSVADSPPDSASAQGTSGNLQFNNSSAFGGSAIKYTPNTGNFTLGPLSFNGSIDGSENLTTVGSQPLDADMVIKKASDGSTLGTVLSGSGTAWVLSGSSATASTDMYAYPSSANVDIGLVINGYDTKYGLKVVGGKTTGQSNGLWVLAGSDSSDTSFVVQDKDGTNLFYMNGLGATVITPKSSSTSYALSVTKPADTTGGGIACDGGAYTSKVALTYSSPLVVDSSKSNVFTVTLTGNVSSFSITNAQEGQTVNILITQDATGSRTITWPATYKFSYGASASGLLSTPANSVDLFVATYLNGNWYCAITNSLS